MNKSKLLILFSILLALAIYTYVVEVKINESNEQKKETAEKIANIKQDDVKEISMQDTENKTGFTVIKDGTFWIIKDIEKRADTSLVNDMLNTLSTKAEMIVAEGDKIDVTAYGITNPKIKIRIKTDKEELNMQIGDKSPIGDFFYVSMPETKRLLTVATYQINKFKKSSSELRNKKISNIPKNNIIGMNISINGKTTELTYENDIWNIIRPVKTAADAFTVKQITEKLSSFEVDKYFDKDNKYKITNPDIKITLTTASDDRKTKATETFLFKKETKNKKEEYFGYYQRENETFFVRKDQFEFLQKKDLFSLRKKDLFTFNRGAEESIEISEKNNSLTLVKKGEVWMSKDRVLSKAKITDLIGNLHSLNVKEFVAETDKGLEKYGIDKKSKKIKILDQNKTPLLELSFGRENSNGVYIRLNNENAVYLIEKDILKKIGTDVSIYEDSPAKEAAK